MHLEPQPVAIAIEIIENRIRVQQFEEWNSTSFDNAKTRDDETIEGELLMNASSPRLHPRLRLLCWLRSVAIPGI